MPHQLLGFRTQAFFLVGEGGREQSCRVHRLHQVVTDRRQKTGFRLAGCFSHTFGFGQCLVQLRQFERTLGDSLLQPFVGFRQGLFGLTERSNVGETHDETAARHGIANQLDHATIGEQAFGGVRPALAHPVQSAGHMHFGFAGAAQAAFGIVTNDVGNRASYADQPVGIVEQFQIAAIPGHQFE